MLKLLLITALALGEFHSFKVFFEISSEKKVKIFKFYSQFKLIIDNLLMSFCRRRLSYEIKMNKNIERKKMKNLETQKFEESFLMM